MSCLFKNNHGRKLKKYYWVFLLLFSLSPRLNAQVSHKTKPAIKYHVSVAGNGMIEIQFNAAQTIYNVLVVIRDNSGNTVFLENQYNFSGPYKRTIDLAPYGKGSFFLKIVNDNDVMNKKIIIP